MYVMLIARFWIDDDDDDDDDDGILKVSRMDSSKISIIN